VRTQGVGSKQEVVARAEFIGRVRAQIDSKSLT